MDHLLQETTGEHVTCQDATNSKANKNSMDHLVSHKQDKEKMQIFDGSVSHLFSVRV